jgi:transcriptional regulator with PAS, ATPase and Fis domain
LLLDEIDTLPLAAQAKLLHAVEERLFMPIGDSNPLAFKGRLVFASNQPLEQLVDQGEFRADLYYRIKVVELSAQADRVPLQRPR